MKKGLYAILAILTIFAMTVMVGCPDSPSDDTPQITITYDLGSVPIGGDDIVAPSNKKMDKGSAIGAARLPVITADVPEGWFHDGWTYEDADGVTQDVETTTRFSANTTLTAVWVEGWKVTFFRNHDNTDTGEVGSAYVKKGEAITAAQIPALPNRGGYRATGWFSARTGGNAFSVVTSITANASVYAQWEEVLSVIFMYNYTGAPNDGEYTSIAYADGVEMGWPQNPTRPNSGEEIWEFVEWNDEADGSGTVYEDSDGGDIEDMTASLTLYAQWNDTNKLDLEGAEIMYLENGACAAYEFDLTGTTFGAFETITAEFMVATKDGQSGLAFMRMFGAFDPDELIVDDNGAVYAPANTYRNGGVGIYDDVGGAAYSAAAARTWFTVTFQLDQTAGSPNGGFDDKYAPDGTDTGKFYFAIGLPGGGDSKPGYPSANAKLSNGIVSYVRNVRMNAFSSHDDDVYGTVPASISTSGAPIDVSNGQFFMSYCDPIVFSWRNADPTATPTIPVDPSYVPPDAQGPAATEDFVFLSNSDTPIVNALPRSDASFDDSVFRIPITFPVGFNLSSYDTFTVSVVFYDGQGAANDGKGDTMTPTSNPGLASLKFKVDVEEDANLKAIWDLGINGIEENIPQEAKDRQLTFGGIHIEGNNDDVEYIEITEIIFYAPPAKPVGDYVVTGFEWIGDWSVGSVGTQNQDYTWAFANGTRIHYTIPKLGKLYANVVLEFTIEAATTGDTGPFKLAVKESTGGQGNPNNLPSGNNTWPGTSLGENTLTYPLEAFPQGGICFEYNNDASQDYKLKITKITFTDD